jgi:hypothetical protein
VPADWTCVWSCDDGACGGVGCTIPVCTAIGAPSHRAWPVPFSADDGELTERRVSRAMMDLRVQLT